jgi:hypothetical protein
MTLRKLVNDSVTVQRMMDEEVTIDTPAYQYFGVESLKSEVESRLQ